MISRPATSAVVLFTLLLAASCGRKPEVIQTRHQTNPAVQIVANDSTTQDGPQFELAIGNGLSMLRSEKFERAGACFSQAVQLRPDSWRAHYYFGLCQRHLEEFEKSEQSFHSSLELAPADDRARSRIYVMLGELFEVRGMLGKAELNFLTAIRLWPDSIDAREGLKRLKQYSAAPTR